MTVKTLLVLAGAAICCASCVSTRENQADGKDAEYIKLFQEKLKRSAPVPTLEEYASPARYDQLFMGGSLKKAFENVSNDTGGLAWGLSYRMASLNNMYRVTGDVKYLQANLDCVRAVAAATDDKRGKKLWTGAIAKAWGCDKYAPDRGRAVFAVHTGIIAHPILDFLLLAKQEEDTLASLLDDRDELLATAQAALAFHDPQWREGPGKGEGHYIGLNQEPVCDDKPLPGNRLSAMGQALWVSWKLTGNETHRDRARAIGRYIKNRVTPSPDRAYYWPYWLPEERVSGRAPAGAFGAEDTSHAGLTLALPIMLAAEGEVFTRKDMVRFGNTVVKGFGRLGDGVLWGNIAGTGGMSPRYIGNPAKYLALARYVPEVRDIVVAFYLNYRPTPQPNDLAQLLMYAGD